MTKSKIFLYLCLSFVGGIFVNSIVFIPQLLMLGFLILGIFLISVFWRYKKLMVIGFCLLFLVLGIWRHQQVISEIVYPEEKEITFIGQVVKEPDIRNNNTKLTVSVHGTFHGLKNESRVLVTTNRYPEYQYGDELKITGKLQIPQEFEDFNYKGYLAKNGVYSVMYWPEIELVEKEAHRAARVPTSVFYAKILEFKDKLRESIYRNLSPPQSSILGAIILGDKRRMSEELKGKLNLAGVRHITAVSGLHVAVLTGILMSIFASLGFRRKAFYFTIIIVALFILMTGLQASAIRAGIMGVFYLWARHLGRESSSSRAIVFAAGGMLAQNPLLLRLDIGFQLSFLAILGIIYLMPTVKRYLKSEVLAMTISAYVFTLPILIYNFGYFSLVAVFTNFLIVPLMPYAIGAGFISGFAGIFSQTLGWILSWPSWLLLTYIVKIVEWFSQVPSVII